MKRTKIFAIATLITLAASGSAFAAATTFTDAGTITCGTPSVGLKPSKNVQVYYLASTTAVTGTTGFATYAITASHGSGTKTFGSSSGDTKIFMKDGTSIAPPTAPAVGSSADFSGWTAM